MKRNIAISLASRSLSMLLIITSFSFLVVGEKIGYISLPPQNEHTAFTHSEGVKLSQNAFTDGKYAEMRGYIDLSRYSHRYSSDREIIKSLAQRSHLAPPSPLTKEIDNAIAAVVTYPAGAIYSYETTPAMREVLSKYYVAEYQYAYQEHSAGPGDLRATLLRSCLNLGSQFIIQFADDEFGTPVNVRGPNGYRARERLSKDTVVSILAAIGGAARLNAKSMVSLLGERQSESKVTDDRPDDTALSPQHEQTALIPSDVVRRYWKVSADGEFTKAWRYIDACGLNSKHSIDKEIIKSLTQRIPWIIRNNPKISDRRPGELVIGKIEEESLKGETASVVAIVHFRNSPFIRSLFRLKRCKGEWKIENAEFYYKDAFDLRNNDNRKVTTLPLLQQSRQRS